MSKNLSKTSNLGIGSPDTTNSQKFLLHLWERGKKFLFWIAETQCVYLLRCGGWRVKVWDLLYFITYETLPSVHLLADPINGDHQLLPPGVADCMWEDLSAVKQSREYISRTELKRCLTTHSFCTIPQA